MKLFHIITGLFLFIFGFIFGLSISYKHNTDLIETSKRTVLGYLNNPKLESFKDVIYYKNKISHNGGEVGYVCGLVSDHNDLHHKMKSKKFIVKTYSKPDGTINISIPMIEGMDEFDYQGGIEKLWDRNCTTSNGEPTSSNLK
ncbi:MULTISPECIES: hypothetical protein [unclassified Providencia]|uniref:hypothetical protein n=1 Tax=unclassified Providencia TaxID=2633465 RepID=UPI00234A475B|nr:MULTISPECIES: hypothetical protein [unclassified Providencia]